MKNRLASGIAVLSVVALMGWLGLVARESARDRASSAPGETPGGFAAGTEPSTEPCAVPLAWRIARLDDEFGLSVREARAAVEDAGALWEEAAGIPLFRHDPAGGFPVHFVYDERQARTRERLRASAAVAELERGVEERRRELERLRQARALEEARVRLEGGARELEARGREIREREEALGRALEELRVREEALERAFPPAPVESARYREWLRPGDPGGRALQREIRVYRFDDRDDLLRVLAHELGHALGLGHAEAPAVMSQEYERRDVLAGAPRIGSGDRALLRARCPDLR